MYLLAKQLESCSFATEKKSLRIHPGYFYILFTITLSPCPEHQLFAVTRFLILSFVFFVGKEALT